MINNLKNIPCFRNANIFYPGYICYNIRLSKYSSRSSGVQDSYDRKYSGVIHSLSQNQESHFENNDLLSLMTRYENNEKFNIFFLESCQRPNEVPNMFTEKIYQYLSIQNVLNNTIISLIYEKENSNEKENQHLTDFENFYNDVFNKYQCDISMINDIEIYGDYNILYDKSIKQKHNLSTLYINLKYSYFDKIDIKNITEQDSTKITPSEKKKFALEILNLIQNPNYNKEKIEKIKFIINKIFGSFYEFTKSKHFKNNIFKHEFKFNSIILKELDEDFLKKIVKNNKSNFEINNNLQPHIYFFLKRIIKNGEIMNEIIDILEPKYRIYTLKLIYDYFKEDYHHGTDINILLSKKNENDFFVSDDLLIEIIFNTLFLFENNNYIFSKIDRSESFYSKLFEKIFSSEENMDIVNFYLFKIIITKAVKVIDSKNLMEYFNNKKLKLIDIIINLSLRDNVIPLLDFYIQEKKTHLYNLINWNKEYENGSYPLSRIYDTEHFYFVGNHEMYKMLNNIISLYKYPFRKKIDIILNENIITKALTNYNYNILYYLYTQNNNNPEKKIYSNFNEFIKEKISSHIKPSFLYEYLSNPPIAIEFRDTLYDKYIKYLFKLFDIINGFKNNNISKYKDILRYKGEDGTNIVTLILRFKDEVVSEMFIKKIKKYNFFKDIEWCDMMETGLDKYLNTQKYILEIEKYKDCEDIKKKNELAKIRKSLKRTQRRKCKNKQGNQVNCNVVGGGKTFRVYKHICNNTNKKKRFVRKA